MSVLRRCFYVLLLLSVTNATCDDVHAQRFGIRLAPGGIRPPGVLPRGGGSVTLAGPAAVRASPSSVGRFGRPGGAYAPIGYGVGGYGVSGYGLGGYGLGGYSSSAGLGYYGRSPYGYSRSSVQVLVVPVPAGTSYSSQRPDPRYQLREGPRSPYYVDLPPRAQSEAYPSRYPEPQYTRPPVRQAPVAQAPIQQAAPIYARPAYPAATYPGAIVQSAPNVSSQVATVNSSGDLQPGMVLPDGSRVVSVGSTAEAYAGGSPGEFTDSYNQATDSYTEETVPEFVSPQQAQGGLEPIALPGDDLDGEDYEEMPTDALREPIGN